MTGYVGGGKQLASGGGQLKKGLDDLDADDEDPVPGGYLVCFLRQTSRRG